MTLPTVHMTGNLAADPETRQTQSGKTVCNFTVIANKSKQDASGQWQNVGSCSMRCTAFDSLAEHCAASLRKGVSVTVTGSMEDHTYEKDGVTRYTKQMTVSDVAVSLKRHTVQVAAAQSSQRPQQAAPMAAQPMQPPMQQAPAADPWSQPSVWQDAGEPQF